MISRTLMALPNGGKNVGLAMRTLCNRLTLRIPFEDGENGTVYHLWTFENGKKLMYRPSWKLKLSGLVQGLFVWLYAIFDAWRGEKGFNKRAFKTRLRRVKEQEEVEESGN